MIDWFIVYKYVVIFIFGICAERIRAAIFDKVKK